MGYGLLKVVGTKPQVMTMGVIDLRKYGDHYLKLRRIFERVVGIIEAYLPDELAIEAPFFGKNVQSMLKLGRAQGVAMAAALSRDIPITEYAPLKIKMAITGNGQASKEQVADMLKRMLHIPESDMLPFMDATDGLAAAYCHYLQMGRPTLTKEYSGWKDFINKNPDKIKDKIMNVRHVIWASIVSTTISCQSVKKEYNSFDEYPVREDALTEMEYSPAETKFSLWAPTAEEVRVLLFESGNEGSASNTFPMEMGENGTWNISIKEDLKGKFYTFNVKVNGKWLGDTPGIMAKAVGVNGKRAAVLDLRSTDPEGWENDVRPPLKNYADITVYEMHHRDFSLDSVSGIQNKGKFLALTEQGTTSSSGEKTGIDHLKELGITHVHLLPSYDYASVDETKLDKAQYNWGYDPQNYNVPDGSYSTDPYKPDVRIREFKQMVQALHKAGIRVVLDVVYNHTFNTDESNFERTVPGYFYRQTKDGQWANGSGCGNETASDRAMMRKYMIESILYWINEYHIDGFRFDLMGIHDIETMNEIRAAIDKIDPSIFMYGEGWAASSPQLEADRLAMKANVEKMPRIAAFSDEMRDGLRGGWDDDTKGAFLVGEPGHEMSIKFGIVGAIEHPQVISDSVNYSKKPWALQPTQMISYVSCHDDMCLADRLKATMPDASVEELAALQKLAETFVFTSQGVPFIFAGDEMMRDKKGVHNSYNSPDSINTIDWKNKTAHKDVFEYVKGLIAMRKAHPAFRMGDADMVRRQLEFLPVENTNVVAFILKDNANGDSWKNIIVALNSRAEPVKLDIPSGKYTVICKDGKINMKGLGQVSGDELMVPARSAMIIHQ